MKRRMSSVSTRVAAASLLAVAAVAGSGHSSTLVQTQLIGVKGATVLSFVSQYLPPEIKALEPQLKIRAEDMLKSAGLTTPGDRDQYLKIDVTGDAVSSELCTNAFMLQVVVAFSEPIRLSRAHHQRLPNNSTLDTWQEVYRDVVPQSELQRIVTTQVAEAVALFIDTVKTVNQEEKTK